MKLQGKAPAIIAFTSPFRLVFRDQRDHWSPTLAQIQKETYDHAKLHRISASLDIGLPNPMCLHLAFDGSLLIPKVSDVWPVEKAVGVLNQVLGEILLGGIYYDAVQPTDVDQGWLYTTGYFRSFGLASSLTAQLHLTLQTRISGAFHSILLYEPRHLYARDVLSARASGARIASKVPTLRVELLLHGVSAFVSHDWASALSYLWITVEQVISFMWDQNVVTHGRQPEAPIEGRGKFLEDHRTWVTAACVEVLYQLGVVPEGTYRLLNAARKARNDLAHRGTTPDRSSAEAVLDAVSQLLARIHTPNDVDSFTATVASFKALDPVERHYAPLQKIKIEDVGLWLGPLPPIPGEADWGDKDYERVYLDSESRST
jgi:hypothetical protein